MDAIQTQNDDLENPRKRRVFAELLSRWEKGDRSPTVDDVAASTGLKRSSAHYWMIRWTPPLPREKCE